MQARLVINRFPSIVVAIVVGLVAAFVLGGTLGYALKADHCYQQSRSRNQLFLTAS